MSNKAKILVFADEAIAAEDLRLTLTELGYDVFMVLPSGEEVAVSRLAGYIGISLASYHGVGANVPLKNDDSAEYKTKKKPNNSFCFYSNALNESDDVQGIMVERLQTALEQGEFVPYYQPRLDTATGRMTGMEVLMRWQPKGASLVYPAEFITILEESGLIVPVGEWLLNAVCRQNKSWQAAGMPPFRVAVKMSEQQFRQGKLPQLLEQALCDSRLDPQYLEIELSESIIMNNVVETARKLRELKKIGIRISIDNFGTGLTSLGYLNMLPVDELKIDKSLVNSITANAENATVVSATIAMGHNLGKSIVADGVESQEQFMFLSQHRCEEVQGYLFSRPLPSQSIEQLFRQGTASYH